MLAKRSTALVKSGNGLVRVAVLDAVAHAVLDMTLEHHLTAAMQRAFCSIDLRENILAGHILIHHAIDSLNLTDNLMQAPMEICRIHALSHSVPSLRRARTTIRTS